MKLSKRFASVAVSASMLVLTGCPGDLYPDTEVTNKFVLGVLLVSEGDDVLPGTYHVMQDREKNQLGAVFIQSVNTGRNKDGTSELCVDYIAFAGRKESGAGGDSESETRKICIKKSQLVDSRRALGR